MTALFVAMIALGIYWFIQTLMVRGFLSAAIITCIIVYVFIDIDSEKEIMELKSKDEIIYSVNRAKDGMLSVIEKIGNAFNNGRT